MIAEKPSCAWSNSRVDALSDLPQKPNEIDLL